MIGSVYTLSCPIENVVKYVGMTVNSLESRLQGHISQPLPKNTEWINTLQQKNLKPIIEELEQINGSKIDLALAEKYWIGQFIAWGFELNNTLKYAKYTYTPKRELRLTNVSDELFKALHDMALIENRSISNLAETALNSFFKIKPKK